jgi:hypothetical protein
MKSRDKFTDQEWRAMLGGVFMAGFAVTAAQPSGLIGMIKEGIASRRALREAGKSASTNALVAAVATALRTPSGRKITNEFTGALLRRATREDLKVRAIAAVREAMAIVKRRAPEDAPAFSEWLLHIATRVAQASKEGSFLGFGGATIGEVESATLAEIAAALRTNADG